MSEAVTGKIILTGQVALLTPLIIGSGANSGDIDITVIKDEVGIPYIPATSFAGVLRHYFWENFEHAATYKEQFLFFWGADETGQKSDICMSALHVSDLLPLDDVVVRIRDGVTIDRRLGRAEDGKKYDYEVVEPGVKFGLRMEITLREMYEQAIFLKVIATLVKALKENKISVGAMTTKGFGRIKLVNEELRVLNFKQKEHVLAWLSSDYFSVESQNLLLDDAMMTEEHDFIIRGSFALKSSLLVRSYSGDTKMPDAVHIESNGEPVLPGTSLKGALRHRAFRIYNVLGGRNKELLYDLWGWADDKGDDRRKMRSRLIIEEVKISHVKPEVHSRIKIDRFTGGVMRAALFDSMPLWSKDTNQETTAIVMRIKDYQDWEAGLLLLLLKDLWNEDLPVGGEKNIGRGLWRGLQAEIIAADECFTISRNVDRGLYIEGDMNKLEAYVQAFVLLCRERGGAYAG